VADAEEQIDFRRPRADPLQRGHGLHRFLGRKIVYGDQIKAVGRGRSDAGERAYFCAGLSDGAKRGLRCAQELFRRERIDSRLEASPDRCRRGA
jgi:hypothetical protein